MNTQNLRLGLALFALICAIAAAFLGGQPASAIAARPNTTVVGGAFEPSFQLEDIPPPLRRGYQRSRWSTASNAYTASATYSAALNKVQIDWSDGSGSKVSQDLATTFFPTAVGYVGQDRLCVAGVEADGDTVVEVWLLVDPKPVVDADSGQPDFIPGGPARKARVYEDAVPGRHMVQTLIPFIDSSAAALVQYFDSSDVYRVDLTTGVHTLVASPDPLTAATFVAGLENLHLAHWSRRHITVGFFYVLGDARQVEEITVLIDTDADTVIDQVVVHDVDSFNAAGMADSSSFY